MSDPFHGPDRITYAKGGYIVRPRTDAEREAIAKWHDQYANDTTHAGRTHKWHAAVARQPSTDKPVFVATT